MVRLGDAANRRRAVFKGDEGDAMSQPSHVDSPEVQKCFHRAISSGLLPDKKIVDWSWHHGINEVSTVTVTYYIEEEMLRDFLDGKE